MAGKVGPFDQGVQIERTWWNGLDHHSAECAYITLGVLPDGRFFVQHTGTGKWSAFDVREDALAVARIVAKDWTPVIVKSPAPSLA